MVMPLQIGSLKVCRQFLLLVKTLLLQIQVMKILQESRSTMGNGQHISLDHISS